MNEAKAPISRPAVVRDKQLRILMSDEERSAFKAEAEKVGASMSTWARMQLRRAAGLAE